MWLAILTQKVEMNYCVLHTVGNTHTDIATYVYSSRAAILA